MNRFRIYLLLLYAVVFASQNNTLGSVWMDVPGRSNVILICGPQRISGRSFTMTKRILVLGGMSIAIVFGQNAGGGRGRGGAPAPPPEPGTAKERQLWAYDVKPVPNYVTPKTPWGEPDLQGIWPINHLIAVPLTRPKQFGDRLYRTDQEFASLTARARGTGAVPDRDYPDRLMRQ